MHGGAIGRSRPEHGGKGGNGQFGKHPAGADDDAVPFVTKGPGARRIHERQRREEKQGQAHLVDLTAGAGLASKVFA